ncbi:transposase, partial [Salmonella enterica subsp. enterica serovar Enteritidis]|nr:transposase [Salmonella enterica subsp. enterica serovar Enteritidis]
MEIDNNICENALRCVALGRRNYLFFGSDRSGEAAAIIYSLLGTCKLNGVESEAWLRDVLWKISDWLFSFLTDSRVCAGLWTLSSV